MAKPFLAAWLGLAVMAAASGADAGTYFVNVVEGNDTNSGLSVTSAWAHLPGTVGGSGAGWTPLVQGDSVIVKGGTTNNLQVKCTPDFYRGNAQYDSIRVQSGHLASPPWGTAPAIIDGQGVRTYGIWFSGNFASGPLRGVTFDGFEVRNIAPGEAGTGFDPINGSACILVGGNYPTAYLTIKRCWLHDAFRNADDRGHGIEFSGGSDWIVTQNTVGPNIGTKGCEPAAASRGVISNNFFSGTGDHCIALTRSTNVDVCNNVIFNIPPQVHEPQFGITLSKAAYCDVWNNLIYRPVAVVNAPGQDWSMGLGMYTTCVSNRIVCNTIAYFGDYVNGGSQTIVSLYETTLPNTNIGTIFQNNIVYGGFNSAGQNQWYVRTTTVGLESVKYNAFFGSQGSGNVMSYNDGTGYKYAPVASFNPGFGHGYERNVQSDPALTGGPLPTGLDVNYQPNTAHFRPTSRAHPLILTTGNALQGDAVHGYSHDPAKFATDIKGARRSVWTMGAYEVPPNLPPPPTGLRIVPGP